MSLAPLLVLALAAPGVTWIGGWLRPAWAGALALATSAAAFAALLAGWLAGAEPLDLPWAPAWGLRATFALDGLGALYALLAAGIATLVVAYALRYLPAHLATHDRPLDDAVRFYTLLTLFMVAMIGLATAQDLLVLFVFWDLTAVTSYFLIAYDRELPAARSAALTAILVTGITSVGFLVGIVVLHARLGTFSLPAILEAAEPGPAVSVATALVTVAALAKSAQVPLHFWLPRAMVAPTPVSAYLHSAAMVAAGVFLLQRVSPLLALAPEVKIALVALGLTSIAVGSLLALTRDTLKPLLAYSTVAQYGYVVVLLGLGGKEAAIASTVYVAAHAIAKSTLFLVAGAVTEATGEDRLGHLGGLARSLPVLAAAGGIAAAALAGLPLTVGFFKDDLFFAAMLARGPVAAGVSVLAAGLTVAYAWRFWAGIFLGRRRRHVEHPPPACLVAPVAVLAALALVAGIAPSSLEPVTGEAASLVAAAPVDAELAYHLDARPENVLALAAWATGTLLIVFRRRWTPLADAVARAGERAGPARVHDAALAVLNRFSSRLMALERRSLRGRIASVLAPSAGLVALAFVTTGTWRQLRVGDIGLGDVPLVLALLLVMAAALGVTVRRRHLTLALSLGSVGYSLTAVYAFLGAPDVALVAVLVETMFTLLLVGVLALFPAPTLAAQARRAPRRIHRWRSPLLAVAAGGLAFVVGWSALSLPASAPSAAASHLRLSPEAHGRDVVTVILADFRGLDTLGEITVVAIALIGITSLLARPGRR